MQVFQERGGSAASVTQEVECGSDQAWGRTAAAGSKPKRVGPNQVYQHADGAVERRDWSVARAAAAMMCFLVLQLGFNGIRLGGLTVHVAGRGVI